MDEAVMREDETLRDRQATATRMSIVQAAQRLLVDEHGAALTFPAVAAEAGVSLRTAYRYFPNKQSLLDAVANYFPDRFLAGGEASYRQLQTEAGLAQLWTAFADEIDAVRAQHRSPAGAELRQRRLAESRTETAKLVAELHPEASEADRERLTDLLVAVCGSAMFLELVDRLGREPAEAAQMAVWIARAAASRFQHKGGMS